MKKNHTKTKVLLSSLLVIIWLLIIFSFSNMNTQESNTKSTLVIEKVIITTNNATNKLGISNKEEPTQIAHLLNKPFRKCMHVSIYLILALLLLNLLKTTNRAPRFHNSLTLIICFIYALTDEYHQTFIVGRTGQFIDVLFDTLGAFLGIIIFKKLIFTPKNKKVSNYQK